MIVSLPQIAKLYGSCRGIIHVGAHLMQERDAYLNAGLTNTIWIEGDPETYASIKYVNDLPNKEQALNYVVSDRDAHDVDFHIGGQSSSLLEMDKHKIYHPGSGFKRTLKVSTKRLDTIIKEKNILF